MSTPGNYDIVIYHTETWSMQMDFDLDLTSYTASMEIRDDEGTLVVSPTLAFGTPRSAGVLTASLTSAQTSAMSVGVVKYDLFLTLSGTRTPYLYGRVSVLPKVTTA